MSGPFEVTRVQIDNAALQPSQVWESAYRRILQSGFPSSELVSQQVFTSYATDPQATVWFARDDEDVRGIAVVNRERVGRVALLAYLAVDPRWRAAGIGSALLSHLREREPLLLLEIEDPARHAERGYGDPARRVAFYHRHGVVEIVAPFFQPPVGPGHPPVEGMLLGLLTDEPTGQSVETGSIRRFLTCYLTGSGHSLQDSRSVALLEALSLERLPVRPLLPRPTSTEDGESRDAGVSP